MFLRSVIIFYLCVRLSKGELYDIYSSAPLTEDGLAELKKNNALELCAMEVNPCNATEGRRVDGSCNNLKNPTVGVYFRQMPRMLPAVYENGSRSRKAVDGGELPLPRLVRTRLLEQGSSYHQDLTHLVTAFCAFMFTDIGSIHDIDRFLLEKTDCCEPEHMNDASCSPNIVPAEDPVHRYTDIKCLNLTTPLTYQFYNCTKDPIPAPIAKATTVLDLSQIYNFNNKGDSVIRSFKSGKLAVEEESGKIFPPSNETMTACLLNEQSETRCYKNYMNSLLPINLFIVWFVRHHNYVAEKLSAINPCWDDDKLFNVAREINIATAMQLFYYEWLPTLIDAKSLIKEGVISDNLGFREVYNEEVSPEIYLEYSFSQRWFHILQGGTVKLHTSNGTFVGEMPIVNLTLRTGWLAKDKNMEQMTKAHYTQPCHGYRHSVDHDLSERGLPYVQRNVDITASDLHKSRLFGLRPYTDYVYHCFGINITCFDDLHQLMSKDMVSRMNSVYKNVHDIDVMAGMWGEKAEEGSRTPPTLACFMRKTLRNVVQGDRHWYESKNRPNAFTEEQLAEMRKTSLSSMLCAVGDDVTKIQRKSLLNISPENPLVSCDEITKMDFNAWADSSCNSS